MTKTKKKTAKKSHSQSRLAHWLAAARFMNTPWWAAAAVVVVGSSLTWVLMVDAMEPLTSVVGARGSAVQESNTAPIITARRLDGVVVAPGQENKWPIGVMIENLPVVRPQAGLGSAKVVFETLAEGGATRFFALFDGTENLAKLGPVRSARKYYVNWATEYSSVYAHAGGAPDALIELAARKLLDLNGIGGAAKYFWRDKTISAPHNLFTSSEKLNTAVATSPLATQVASYDSWVYKDDAAVAKRGAPAKQLVIAFSGRAFEAEWEYHADTNTYFRSTAGVAHRDSLTKNVIQAKNVVVEFLPNEKFQAEKGRLSLNTTGSGRVLIFRDGKMVEGTWKKQTIWRRTSFVDADGQPIALNRGTTWVEVVPGQRSVTY